MSSITFDDPPTDEWPTSDVHALAKELEAARACVEQLRHAQAVFHDEDCASQWRSYTAKSFGKCDCANKKYWGVLQAYDTVRGKGALQATKDTSGES